MPQMDVGDFLLSFSWRIKWIKWLIAVYLDWQKKKTLTNVNISGLTYEAPPGLHQDQLIQYGSLRVAMPSYLTP